MLMIPSQPHRTDSRAEKKIFDLLRSTFSNDWFALHSLNLPRHEYKRFGEIDFLICGPQGLFVLEVKGGGVSCHDGIWETTDRYKETHCLKESPFRQAEGALHGLLQKLPSRLASGLTVGYGVLTPDTRLSEVDSAEWDAATLADQQSCRQFERWLKNLIQYWAAKPNNARRSGASAEELRELKQFLRPNFDVAIPLSATVHDLEEQIVRMTDNQLKVIDQVENNPRILCSGGAGTGKTMLALELARRWTAIGKQVALVCYSPWLKSYLAGQSINGLTVALASKAPVAARRAGVEKFDVLIVDEAQDLLNLDDLAVLEAVLDGGLENGRWCFFHDVNNQSGLCGSYSPDAYDYLREFRPALLSLPDNCRNTRQILEHLQNALGADLGVAGIGEGPAVETRHEKDRATAVAVLAEILDQLAGKGFYPNQIVVLSPLSFHESCASDPGLQDRIQVLDAYGGAGGQRNKVGFAEVANFKGLESDVIVLIDLPPFHKGNPEPEMYYVGMSRAKILLITVSYKGDSSLPSPGAI